MEEQKTQDQCEGNEPQKYNAISTEDLFVKLFNMAAEDIWPVKHFGHLADALYIPKCPDLVRADKVENLQPSAVEPIIETAEQAYDRAMKIIDR